ncbi:hypothetical protein [Jongsikchunia kroppenstedtii]|uniref:hypothetical protein n=1 Tax=Jongsikchunia kroppenstedtii TaxID=1121721 RepID=UPI003F8405A5
MADDETPPRQYGRVEAWWLDNFVLRPEPEDIEAFKHSKSGKIYGFFGTLLRVVITSLPI